jgi:hypothetical protein
MLPIRRGPAILQNRDESTARHVAPPGSARFNACRMRSPTEVADET